MTRYSIYIETSDGGVREIDLTAKTMVGAMRQMRQQLRTAPSGKAYLIFFRTSDGQEGYINERSGAELHGYPWSR